MGLKRLVNAGVLAGWGWLDRVGQIVPGTRAADGFGSFGDGTLIGFPTASLVGTHAMHFGAETLVGRQATLAAGWGPGDPHVPARALVVGDRCVLGARITILAHQSVEIGDAVWFGQDIFVSDSGHGYQDPTRPIGEQFGSVQPVRIGSGSWLGHGSIVLPGAQIGRNVVVAAGSVVRGVIPDHSVVGGAPAKVIRRYEPGVGWVGTHGDVRPVVIGTLEELLARMDEETA